MANIKPIEYGTIYSYIGEAWRGPGYGELEPKTVEAKDKASGITYRLLKALEKQGYQVAGIPRDVEVAMNTDLQCVICHKAERINLPYQEHIDMPPNPKQLDSRFCGVACQRQWVTIRTRDIEAEIAERMKRKAVDDEAEKRKEILSSMVK